MPVRDLLNAASTQGASPADPYFYDVSLLLNGDGTNGAQNNTFLDSSTNNFTITRNGNTTQGSFSPYGSLWSNYFVGTSGSSASPNYLATPSSSVWAFGTGAFTLECWGYLTSAPDVANGWNFFDFRTGTSLTVGWQNDQMFTYDGTTTITSSSVSSYLNKWTHWAWMRSGSTVYLFANGVVIGSGSMSTNFGTSASVCTINARYSGVQSAGGFFSNARVSNIARYATTGFTPATTNFTNDANTLLLTMQNNRFIDNSSNNFTLTVNGTPSVQRFSPFNPTSTYSTSVIGGSGYLGTGGSDYLTVSSNAAFCPGTGQFSVEYWYYKSAYGGNEGVMINTEATGGLIVTEAGGGVALSQRSTGNNLQSSTTLTVGTWTHIVVCRNGSNVTSIFVNGTRVVTGTVTANFATGALYIGDLPVSGYWATGYYAGLRIVKGSTPYDPTQSTITVPTAPPTAIANTGFLANFTNAGIPDLAMQNDLQTVGSAQVSTSVVKYGTGSLSFNGSGDYLTTPPNTYGWNFGTGNFTVELWIYPIAATNRTIMADRAGSTGTANAWSLEFFNTALRVEWHTGLAIIASSNTNITLNVWSHIAVVRNSGTLTIYQNGTSVASVSDSNNYSEVNPLNIGYEPVFPSGNSNFYGYMDDIRITNGIARYTANFTPPTSALPTY